MSKFDRKTEQQRRFALCWGKPDGSMVPRRDRRINSTAGMRDKLRFRNCAVRKRQSIKAAMLRVQYGSGVTPSSNPPKRDQAKAIALESGLTYGSGHTTLGAALKNAAKVAVHAVEHAAEMVAAEVHHVIDPLREKRQAAARKAAETRKANNLAKLHGGSF